DCGRIGGLGIGCKRCRCDTQWVLGIGARDDIGDQREPVGIVDGIVELAVERLIPGAAVIAIPIDLEVREIDVVSQGARGAECVQAGAVVAEAPVRYTAANLQGSFARGREQLNDSTRGVAIQCREGTSQYLDSRGRVQVELRDLALSVRARSRD